MELFLRVVFSLGAVLGLMWFIARVASRRLGGTSASLVRVVGRQAVGRTASVAVVAVGERMLVVGVTEGGVRLLTELDPTEVPASAPVRSRDEALGEDEPAAFAPATGALAGGSVLSPQTWRQAWQAATTRSGAAT